MTDHARYTPGPAMKAKIEKHGEKWTLILVRELRHTPEKVWQALTDPAQVREWAPYDTDANLGAVGSVHLTWTGTAQAVETRITRAEAQRILEVGDMRWELEPTTAGTRLTLWHSIDRRYVSWGAAGWQIAFDVLDHLLDGDPLGRIAGADAMQYGWQRLVGEYTQQFSSEDDKL